MKRNKIDIEAWKMSLSLLENPADKVIEHFGNGGNSLFLFSSLCSLMLGVGELEVFFFFFLRNGELDVESSFWELETFLNSETYN